MMRQWEALPGSALKPAGPLSAEIMARGVNDFRAAARCVQKLAYGRTLDRTNFGAVLREGKGTCSTKHAYLAALAREQNLKVALMLGVYKMRGNNTPGIGAVLYRHGIAFLPEAHCYLIYEGTRIDVTRVETRPAETIDFLHEEIIAPEQIGGYKAALHRQFMQRWITENPDQAKGRSLEEMWRIREECIAALGQ
jgi:hypothetical protein